MKLFKLFFLLLLSAGWVSNTTAQTNGNGGSIPWVVLTNEYDTSPFNDTTKVDVYFDASDYDGVVTSLQFKVSYDGTAFDKVYEVVHNLSNDYIISYNDNTTKNEVLISLVYVGSDTEVSIPDTAITTIKLDNIPNALLYSNQQNLNPFTFAGYTAGGSNNNSTDISVGTFNHGGNVNIPHRKFSGYVLDYATNKGIPNLVYELYRNNSIIQTVLANTPTRTSNTGYYEMVYYEYFYGYIEEETDFDFVFKTELIDSDIAISTADSYKLLLFANEKITLTPIQKLAGDVNHSHTLSIADSYANYSYNAGVYSGWSNLGDGGYRDVMIIKPEDVRFLESDSLTVTNIGIGPLGFSPQETNWTYDLNAYNGINDTEETFYVVIMGDVNETSIGGSVPPTILNNTIKNNPFLQSVSTSILAKLPDTEVTTGDEFYVDLLLDTKGIDIHSFNFELDYDPTVLQFLEASTPYLPNSWQLFFTNNEVGKIKYGGMDASAGDFPMRTDTTETILQFKFKALGETGIAETPIHFGDKYNAGNNIGDDVDVDVLNGTVYLTVVTSVFEEEMPNGYLLEQNYPNPFNPSTNIRFLVGNPQNVSLDLYDMSGRWIKNLYTGFTSTGEYNVYLSADNLTSGVYLYVLKTEMGTQTKKLTIIK